eukprot:CAMPEP_0172449510 /NCGR_PEP_ID=MMETSP1065-20121228/8197_1 /TAXON_ID=265537 /ORGANISM="Amphiprora paludosa, Strain CCMP125" /LENGTH=1052 /DNA_ID=CAMNT_0013201197 /DNA_START=155 /DNA_END=3313 /DNA_ORIENTATION=+
MSSMSSTTQWESGDDSPEPQRRFFSCTSNSGFGSGISFRSRSDLLTTRDLHLTRGRVMASGLPVQREQRRYLASKKHGRHRDRKGFDPEAKKGEKKTSFAKQFLDPAARGELKKGHTTGIPKLATRQAGKANLKEEPLSTAKRSKQGKDWQQFQDQKSPNPLDVGDSPISSDEAPAVAEPETPPEEVQKAIADLTEDDFSEADLEEIREEMRKHNAGTDFEKSELIQVAQEMAGSINKQIEKSRKKEELKKTERERILALRRGGGRSGGGGKAVDMFNGSSKDDDYFAPELWDEKKYWWKEEDHDISLFGDFDINDYVNKDGEFVYEYDQKIKENPIMDSLMNGEKFEFDNDEVLRYFKKHAPPEEVRKVEEADWSKFYYRTKDGVPETGEDADGLVDVDKMADMKWDDLFPGEEEPDINKDFFDYDSKQQSGGGDDNYNYTEDKFNMPRGRERLINESTHAKMEEEEMDPEEWFFNGQHDILEILKRPDSEFPEKAEEDPALEEVRDLEPSLGAGTSEDFVHSMIEHPTNTARLRFLAVHPNQKREPKPIFPKDDVQHVKNPPQDFVETWVRFLYVTSLPPFMASKDTPADITNVEHASRFETFVANLCGVDSTQVSAANATSAFIGFDSPRALADAIKRGPKQKSIVVETPQLDSFNGLSEEEENEDLKEFVEKAESTEAILELKNLRLQGGNPSNNVVLAQALIREFMDPDLYSEFGLIHPENVFVPLGGNTALLRFDSKDQAASMMESKLFKKRLVDMGSYTPEYLRARRELHHAGFDKESRRASINRRTELREMGKRLLIDGIHMPEKEFYITHASALQIQNVPEGMPAVELTRFFQQYSARRRTIHSSINYAKCELSGKPVQGAPIFIGFDEADEADACVKQFTDGKVEIHGHMTHMRYCPDRKIPHLDTSPKIRQRRSIEQLEDELENWEKFVSEEDIKYLDENGFPRVIVDEVLRGIRRNNAYFGPIAGSLATEVIEPELLGRAWEELVKEYVSIMKECVATPEDPGEEYLEQFYPGQPVDLSIFDKYAEEKKEMERVREVLKT